MADYPPPVPRVWIKMDWSSECEHTIDEVSFEGATEYVPAANHDEQIALLRRARNLLPPRSMCRDDIDSFLKQKGWNE